MTNKLLSRAIVLHTLFEWDFNLETGVADALSPEVNLARNITEFDPDSRDQPFMRRLLSSVLENRHTIERAIAKSEPEWPIEKISRIDRNILRIGVLELLFEPFTVVPERIAIEQAVQLARSFCNKSSAQFVNRVLISVYLNSLYLRLQTEQSS